MTKKMKYLVKMVVNLEHLVKTFDRQLDIALGAALIWGHETTTTGSAYYGERRTISLD